MRIKTLIISILLLSITCTTFAQEEAKKWGFEKKHFLGSQAFMVLTPLLDPSPEFYQLNYGYRLSTKDEISFEAITWTYQGPVGRPYGQNYEKTESSFPGDVKAIGAGLSYKRFIWRNAFAQIHTTAFKQTYRDASKKEIQSGFQLFNTLRFGYHFKLLNNRMFLSPSVAFTYWPVNTNLPESFQVEEDKWPNYFLFEPGLHFGINF